VIKQENLQENARVIGNYLLGQLKLLQKKHPLIGDVRGCGLFIGVELVTDPKNLSPATKEANDVVQILRENSQILISTDGPFDNVLKIKPPLCWTRENAETFVCGVDAALCLIEKKLSKV